MDYTLLPPGQTCSEAGMRDITSPAECFGPARASVNLSSAQPVDYTGFPASFTCVHVASSSQVYFGDSSSDTPSASPNYEYICIGFLTKTASSTASATSTSGTTSTTWTSTTGSSASESSNTSVN